MATYVLVHGAWHGAWCWRHVRRRLLAAGHDVYTPTLTGLADRSHLLSAAINLDTHIADVANLIKWEDLENIVLVGHSYAGFVVSGVVERTPSAISSLVLLDSFYPEDGQCMLDVTSTTQGPIVAAASRGETTVPPRTAASFSVTENQRAWVDAHCTPQPIGTMTQKIALAGARERVAKKTYIRAAGYPNKAFDQAKEKARSNGWRLFDAPCGHDVMVDMPEWLAETLENVA